MRRVINLYRTSVGKKFYMAISGVILVGFLVAHVIGNFKMFMGPESFNHYAEWLREAGYPVFPNMTALWLFRIVLLAAVGIHMFAALQVYLQSRQARGKDYEKEEDLSFAYASRTMRWGGVIIALFVIFHILHFTTGSAHTDFILGDAHRNVVVGFESWWVVGFYTVAMVMLAFHLYHGFWSAFQTVGANHPKYNPYRRPLALVLSLALFIGFMAVPAAVKVGMLSIEGGAGTTPALSSVEHLDSRHPETDGGK